MERRKHTRFQIAVSVVTPQAISFDATLTDISAGGVGLESTRLILPGTKISIFMKLHVENELRGTVIWTLDFSRNGEILYHMGVQTDVIVSPHKKAYDFSDRAKLVEKILYELDTHRLTPLALN